MSFNRARSRCWNLAGKEGMNFYKFMLPLVFTPQVAKENLATIPPVAYEAPMRRKPRKKRRKKKPMATICHKPDLFKSDLVLEKGPADSIQNETTVHAIVSWPGLPKGRTVNLLTQSKLGFSPSPSFWKEMKSSHQHLVLEVPYANKQRVHSRAYLSHSMLNLLFNRIIPTLDSYLVLKRVGDLINRLYKADSPIYLYGKNSLIIFASKDDDRFLSLKKPIHKSIHEDEVLLQELKRPWCILRMLPLPKSLIYIIDEYLYTSSYQGYFGGICLFKPSS